MTTSTFVIIVGGEHSPSCLKAGHFVQRLWTPWRMRYVGGERAPGCVFCNAFSNPDDRESLVLYVGEGAFMLLNRFPYNSGHLMVVPRDHVPSTEDLPASTRAEMMEMVNLAIVAGRAVFRCDGFNLGMNIGQVAGAGIADHVHMHLVPRWTGDANFMPILGETMVLPETLDATHGRLKAEITTRIAGSDQALDCTAGALVYLPSRDAFVLRKTGSNPVVLPKGHLEPGETAAEAAMREVREETGIEATVAGWLGAQVFTPHRSPEQDNQHAVYVLASGRETPDFEEHLRTDTVLVAPEDLLDSVTLKGLKQMLEQSLPSILQLSGRTS
jgi:ATP adenylyltransferase